jgi:hypothetical protein
MFEEFRIKYLGIQPVAKVTTLRLERLIAREFPKHIDEVTLKLYKVKGDNPNGINRISSAILKLANKDLSSIDHYIEMANADSRDVLSLAEYPRYSKIGFDDFDKNQMKSVYLDDWREYSKWLND